MKMDCKNENVVCKMTAIFSLPQCVKAYVGWHSNGHFYIQSETNKQYKM